MFKRHELPDKGPGEGETEASDECRLQFMGLRESGSSRKLEKLPGAITIFFIVHGKGSFDGATRGPPRAAPG